LATELLGGLPTIRLRASPNNSAGPSRAAAPVQHFQVDGLGPFRYIVPVARRLGAKFQGGLDHCLAL